MILSIWSGNLGNALTRAAKLDWFYARGEAGIPVARLLRHVASGNCVGFAAAGPRRALWNGHSVRIGLLVDMAVVAEHRSLFPALLLQRSLQEAVPGEFAAMYGFPNVRATPVFARVGYVKVLDIGRFVRILRPGHYLRRRTEAWFAAVLGKPLDLLLRMADFLRAPSTRGLEASWRTTVDPRIDELWASAPRGGGLIGVRDAAFSRWRFETKPGPPCRFFTVNDSTGRLVASFACEDDAHTLVVRDFWTSRGIRGIEPSVVRLLLRSARTAGYAAVSLEFGGSADIIRTLHASGFSERDRRPFYCYLGAAHPAPALADWYVTSADEDE